MNLALALAAISLALGIILFFYFRWYIQQRSAAKELLAEFRTEVQSLIADIDFATDRDSQLVEERIKTLKILLEDTDKRIAVYIKELERSRTGEAMYTKLGNDMRRAAALTAPAPMPGAENAAAAAPETAGTAGKKAAAAGPESSAGAAEKKDLRMQIAELEAQGYDASKIAAKLKINVSEAELALSLLRR